MPRRLRSCSPRVGESCAFVSKHGRETIGYSASVDPPGQSRIQSRIALKFGWIDEYQLDGEPQVNALRST